MTTMALTLEDVVQTPRPGSRVPTAVSFSDDGRRVYYLFPEGEGTALSLWEYDTESGHNQEILKAPAVESQETFDEEMRRQRARLAWEGITRYEWNHGRVLVPHHGRLYIAEAGGALSEVGHVEDIVDAHWSHQGDYIYGVKGRDLVRIDWRQGSLETLQKSEIKGVYYGAAEYAAQEELDRSQGYWLSHDDRYLALTEVDERSIPMYPIVHQSEGPVWVEEHRYPCVGEANAKVRLGIRPTTAAGEVQWLSWGAEERYLLDVAWTEDNHIWVLTLARDHKHLAWDVFDVDGSKISRPYESRHPQWINRPGNAFFTPQGALISSTEDLGKRQVVIIAEDGMSRILSPQPVPEWHVMDVVGINAQGTMVYVSVARDLALDRALVAMNLVSGEWTELTSEPGWHVVTVAPHGEAFIDQYGDFDHAPSTTYVKDDTSRVIVSNDVTRASLKLAAPELFRCQVGDRVQLNGLIYKPEGPAPEGGYPLIVSVYAGPHAQMVVRSWDETVDLQAQYLAEHGYVVMKLDSRGSANRGTAFEQAIYHHFGDVELADQVAGIRYLSEKLPINRDRVGIYGWSYGGYMTLRALLMAPEIFKVGVSGAPVTDFRWYDTAYTERYLGTDENNHAGYESTSLMDKAGNLAGHLLLIHGMVDENVHFRNSAAMIQAFINAEKDFDLVVLPGSRHMVRGKENTRYRVRRTLEFFEKHL